MDSYDTTKSFLQHISHYTVSIILFVCVNANAAFHMNRYVHTIKDDSLTRTKETLYLTFTRKLSSTFAHIDYIMESAVIHIQFCLPKGYIRTSANRYRYLPWLTMNIVPMWAKKRFGPLKTRPLEPLFLHFGLCSFSNTEQCRSLRLLRLTLTTSASR